MLRGPPFDKNQSGSTDGARRTRLVLSAAAISRRRASSRSVTPQRSMPFTSRCSLSGTDSSSVKPVRTFTTPPGTSDVDNTSPNVTAGRGAFSDATTTHVLPLTITGATTLTSPRSDDVCGANTATTPMGSGTLKLKYGPATGVDAPSIMVSLSLHPANHTQRSIAASTIVDATRAVRPSPVATSFTNCSRRPSMISATRYST